MAIAFVQGTGIQATGSVASVGKAFVSNVVAGNTLLAMGESGTNTLTATSVTDSLSHSYTRDTNNLLTNQFCYYRSSNIGTGGACTVTLTPSSSDFINLGIVEVSGLNNSAPLDVSATGSGTSNAPATANLVTTDTDIILGTVSNNGNNTAITPGATYTQIFEDEDVSDIPFNFEYKIVASGTYTANWTFGASRAWDCAAVSYKQAAGAVVMPSRPVIVSQAVNRASSW